MSMVLIRRFGRGEAMCARLRASAHQTLITPLPLLLDPLAGQDPCLEAGGRLRGLDSE